MRFELLGPERLDRAGWDDLVSQAPGGSVFHTAEWAGLWTEALPGFTPAFAVGAEGGRYLAGLPLAVRGRFPLARAFSMPMGGYGGVLLRPGLPGRAEDHFRGLAGAAGALRPCLFEIVDFAGQMSFLAGQGFERRTAVTHLLDLEAHGRLSRQKTKRGAVQSARRGVQVRDLTDEAELELCQRLLRLRDMARGQATRYPIGFFRKMWKDMAPLGRARISLAVSDSRIVAFTADLAFGDTVTYWDGASDPESRALRPADALIAAAIEWGRKLGCRWLNLGGSPPGAEGLVRFKENWGAEAREYQVYARSARWFKLLTGLRR